MKIRTRIDVLYKQLYEFELTENYRAYIESCYNEDEDEFVPISMRDIELSLIQEEDDSHEVDFWETLECCIDENTFRYVYDKLLPKHSSAIDCDYWGLYPEGAEGFDTLEF